MSFFGADSGIGPRRIDQRNNRQMKTLGETHEAQSLSIPFAMRTAKIAADILFRITAFLVRNDHAMVVSNLCETSRHRFIISEKPITMQFNELRKGETQIIKCKWTGGMPCDLYFLPSRKVAVDLLPRVFNLLFHRSNFRIEVDRLRF